MDLGQRKRSFSEWVIFQFLRMMFSSVETRNVWIGVNYVFLWAYESKVSCGKRWHVHINIQGHRNQSALQITTQLCGRHMRSILSISLFILSIPLNVQVINNISSQNHNLKTANSLYYQEIQCENTVFSNCTLKPSCQTICIPVMNNSTRKLTGG